MPAPRDMALHLLSFCRMGQLDQAVIGAITARRPWAPGPRHYTPFGFFIKARPDPIGYLVAAAQTYGDIVRIQAGPMFSHVFTHPDHVKYVLQENNRNYWKGKLIAKSKL